MSKVTTKYDYVFSTPIGKLGLVVSSLGIQRLSYLNGLQYEEHYPTDGLAATVYKQIDEYFNLSRMEFDLPLDINGTNYQMRVWREVANISYGNSRTYGEIAKQINSGPRAVGNACRNNPIPIIIPCHRVVKKTGMGGYCGSLVGKQIQQKDWLLRHELPNVSSELLFS